MAVYVDNITEYPLDFVSEKARKYGAKWCHMIADTPGELLDMARRLNLSPAYMQRGGSAKWIHFDLTPSKRAQAIRLGAIPVSSVELLQISEHTNL